MHTIWSDIRADRSPGVCLFPVQILTLQRFRSMELVPIVFVKNGRAISFQVHSLIEPEPKKGVSQSTTLF